MIDQILVAERNPDHPLHDQRFDRVLGISRVARILEARGQLADQPDRPVRRTQQ
jgi:hypothetical protein